MWKIERDSYYSELHHQYGADFIYKAGFFFDTDTVNRDIAKSIDVLCTPVAFLQRATTKPPAVLLSTGSFCPLHFGHIQMMESAKKIAEAAGYEVIGGYLSPSHDEYVKPKTRDGWMPDYLRLKLLRDEIKDHPWLQIDPWEAVFNKVAINFTDVIDRLEAYLKKHTGLPITLFYVFGEDNSRFALTFALKGHCIIVTRPGYAERQQVVIENCKQALIDKRILVAEGSADVSSTRIRNQFGPITPSKCKLQLRIDDSSEKEKAVASLLEPHFTTVTYHLLSEQRRLFARFNNQQMISLDPELRAQHNLGISRHYDFYGATKLRYGVRPTCAPLSQQIDVIPAGSYILFDDDIHTGRTIRFAKQQLEQKQIQISSVASLNISSPEESEILDARDFLLGIGNTGGLVIQLPNGKLTRLPYVYPYVCPFVRASIADPKQFSLDVWHLNKEIHEKTKLRLKDVASLQDYAKYMGYDECMSLAQLCQNHIKTLVEVFSLD